VARTVSVAGLARLGTAMITCAARPPQKLRGPPPPPPPLLLLLLLLLANPPGCPPSLVHSQEWDMACCRLSILPGGDEDEGGEASGKRTCAGTQMKRHVMAWRLDTNNFIPLLPPPQHPPPTRQRARNHGKHRWAGAHSLGAREVEGHSVGDHHTQGWTSTSRATGASPRVLVCTM